MPHDSNGRAVSSGDRVTLSAEVLDVSTNETACNARVRIEAPDGEYHPEIALNTRSLTLVPAPDGRRTAAGEERMLKWFEFAHLSGNAKVTSSFFWDLACKLAATVEPGPERTVAFRKLLEAKDAAVRATIRPGG